MEDRKAELVNEVIFLQERLDELWQVHPENPSHRDVKAEYQEVERLLLETEREITRLNNEEA